MHEPTIRQNLVGANTVAGYRRLCREALAAEPTFVDESPSLVATTTDCVCHLCGMAIVDGDGYASPVIRPTPAGDERLATELTHRACCDLRNGASGDETYLALKMGFWTISRIRKQHGRDRRGEGPHQRWLPGLVAAWTVSADPAWTRLLPGWRGLDLDSPLGSEHGLVLLTRACYVEEREKLKSEQWIRFGGEGRPDWDRSESWRSWEDRHHAWYDAATVKSARALARKERSRHRLSETDRGLVLARTRGDCHFCGGAIRTSFDLDHIVPFARGGSNDLDNFLAAHRWCNGARGQAGPTELNLSLLVGRWLLASLARADDLPAWLHDATTRFLKQIRT